MNLPTLEVDRPRLEVELSGRTYPALETPHARRVSDPEQAEIFSRLWPRFALPDEKPENLDGVVRTYDNDRQKLSEWRSELQRLLEAVAAATFELRVTQGSTHSEMESILAARKETVRTKFGFPPSPIDKTLSAELLLLPPSAVRDALIRELRSQLSQFVESIFATLDRLVDEKAVGLIQWLADNLCRFHFFHDVVVHNSEPIRRQEISSIIVDEQTGRPMTQVTEIRKQAGNNVHRLARHEHDLMNAVKGSIEETTLIIPRSIAAVLAEIPDWLMPMAGIVSGDCFRERIIERDVRSETWERTEQEVLRMYFDPAITIGHYVLLGWGDADNHRERQLQLRELDAARTKAKLLLAQSETWSAGISGVVFLLLSTPIAFLGAVTTPWIYLAAASLGILGLLCLGYGHCQWRVSKSREQSLPLTTALLTIAGCITLTVAAGGAALLAPNLWAWGIAASALGLAVLVRRNLDVRL